MTATTTMSATNENVTRLRAPISTPRRSLASEALSFDRLAAIAQEQRAGYEVADPFPHVVVDGFLPPETLDDVLAEFPGTDAIDWKRFADGTGRKLATRDEAQLGPRTLELIHLLNSSRFLRVLETMTGIEGLIPDPHLEGGGLHRIERGGYLKVHADFNRHEKLRLDRRLNLLVYLNKDWREDYGGHLELWTRDMTRCARKVLPVFNRCVVFSTTNSSYHGHPEPITCPDGWSRKSIALYYYTSGRPQPEVTAAHSTLYQRRPGEKVYSPLASAKAFLHGLRNRSKRADSGK